MGGHSDSPQWRSRLADIFFRGSKNQEVKSDSDSDITLVSRQDDRSKPKRPIEPERFNRESLSCPYVTSVPADGHKAADMCFGSCCRK
ncbi:uncharacterized protein N7484_010188 [Penicillium longicatenatum]|uniref:uncharacterized protein n=1 Tax=Penicillium longicatenatum TaxID=1561947 RepID=UPI00254849A3|nr:uncharacterized protein N7484_010188 [Penicillium longicatenatum]KAJ5636875.1 hypothetical protein N7484_010188 [Penicillium longicatenatum]